MDTIQSAMNAMAKQIEDLKQELDVRKSQYEADKEYMYDVSDLFILTMNVNGHHKLDESFEEHLF